MNDILFLGFEDSPRFAVEGFNYKAGIRQYSGNFEE
jgi:hypothetical protein